MVVYSITTHHIRRCQHPSRSGVRESRDGGFHAWLQRWRECPPAVIQGWNDRSKTYSHNLDRSAGKGRAKTTDRAPRFKPLERPVRVREVGSLPFGRHTESLDYLVEYNATKAAIT